VSPGLVVIEVKVAVRSRSYLLILVVDWKIPNVPRAERMVILKREGLDHVHAPVLRMKENHEVPPSP
jgi:hypothetical protein